VTRALITIVVAATFAGSAWAEEPPPDQATVLAEQACEKLRAKIDFAECTAKLKPVAQAAIEACRQQHQQDREAVKACVRSRVDSAVKELIGKKGDPAAEAGTVAKSICAKVEKKLGAEKFASRFGDVDGCVREMEPKAKGALAECSKHKSKDEHKQCMSEQIKSQIAATGTSKEAEKLAANACAQAQKKNEKKFVKVFGSLENCLAKAVPVAQAAIAKCEQEHQKGSAAYKKCVQAAMLAAQKK
jgi:hypothetical protein